MNRILKASLQTALAAAVFALSFVTVAPREVSAQVLGIGYNAVINSITLKKTTNQVVLGTTNTVTISSTAPASSRTYTLDDALAAAHFGLFSDFPSALQNTPKTVFASAGYTNATSTFSNVTGLAFPVAASTSYRATCFLTWSPGGATTVGPKYIWTGPASPTAVTASGTLAKTVTTNSNLSVSAASFATTLDDAVAVTASITQTDILSLGVVNGVNAGTVQLQAALHSASGTYTLAQGSYCTVQ